MNLADTIVAPSSAPGRSARAFIRVSGPHAFDTLRASVSDRSPATTRGLQHVTWRLSSADGRVLALPVLALLFPGPHSYTAEDSFELQLPGNPFLIERVVGDLIARGCRQAEPGEFTARAYVHARLTLDQAEGVAATIAAQNDEQLRSAGELLSGRTGVEYRAWADQIATLLALVEAGIDFTDQEDVVAIEPATLRVRLENIIASISAHAVEPRAADRATPVVVLVGRPNAGKSTLFNALLGRPRAVVSPVAGTTRDVLAESLDLSADLPGGPTVMLTDLPGLDPRAGRPAEAAAQLAAREAISGADVVVWCDPAARFDRATRPAQFATPATVIRVRTKADLPCADSGFPSVQESATISVCALDGFNLRILRRAIADQSCTARSASIASLLPRHRRALGEVLLQLRGAVSLGTAGAPAPAELVALRLRAALDQLGELVGRISPDDVIGRVFATFCVGK